MQTLVAKFISFLQGKQIFWLKTLCTPAASPTETGKTGKSSADVPSTPFGTLAQPYPREHREGRAHEVKLARLNGVVQVGVPAYELVLAEVSTGQEPYWQFSIVQRNECDGVVIDVFALQNIFESKDAAAGYVQQLNHIMQTGKLIRVQRGVWYN